MPFTDFVSLSATDILVRSVPYLLGLAAIGFIVAGAVLDYHWRTYGVGLIHLLWFRLLFVGAGVVLLGVMYLAYGAL